MPRVGAALIAIALCATAIAVLWFLRAGPFRPALTCGVDDQGVCEDTLVWVGGWDPGWAVYPELAGRITAIEVRPAPHEWVSSRDPGFRDAGWAAVLHRDGYAPVIAACVYGSGDEVLCDTEDGSLPKPSPP